MFKRKPLQPNIKDVAVIGDQKSCALIDKTGTVNWYCLWRFDQPSLFSLLIDEQGGWWSIDAEGKQFGHRYYQDDTAVLVTAFNVVNGSFTVTDFMPTSDNISGICRMVSPSPVAVEMTIYPKPDYSRTSPSFKFNKEKNIVSEDRFEFYIHSSHFLHVSNGIIQMTIPPGEQGWCVLADEKRALPHINSKNLPNELQHTLQYWNQIMSNISYDGPYKEAFYQSFKAIQLVTNVNSGGILAAATTSLPEVLGGTRNYDYRYVWLRDTAMNVSALIRAGSKGREAERFLDFLCAGRNTNKKDLFIPFYDLDHKPAPYETEIPGTGYKHSTPLRIGNNAGDQLQLDGQGNVLLAAKQIYNKNKEKPHWETVKKTASFLVKNWKQKDHGIWEEHVKEQFTSSKVLVAKSFEFLAEYADDEQQKHLWLDTAKEIRAFVTAHCLTSDGAYAVYAGSDAVDVTAALYAVWWYDAPDSPVMLKTIERIEKDYKSGELYHRHLVQANSKEEGVFLAGSLWMAQYYVTAKHIDKAKAIIDAVLNFSTDLGFLPEEGDVKTGEPLGNIPQTFVHASLMGVILDYKEAALPIKSG